MAKVWEYARVCTPALLVALGAEATLIYFCPHLTYAHSMLWAAASCGLLLYGLRVIERSR